MRKSLAFLALGLWILPTGCGTTSSQNPPSDATSTAAAAQPASAPSTSQDREDRIKEGDAVRRSMGY